MNKISEKLESKVRSILVGLLIFTSIILVINVAIQQQHIRSLEREFAEHREMQEFINQGKRFTYTDGRVLFLMCDGFEANDRVKGRATGIYSEHGQTAFSDWLKTSNYLE